MHSTIPHVGNYQNYSFNNQQALLSHKNKFTKLGRWKSTWKLIGIYVSLDFFPSPNISLLLPGGFFSFSKTFVHFLLRSFSPRLNFFPVYFPSFLWAFSFLSQTFKQIFLSETDQISSFSKIPFLHSIFFLSPRQN